jgi:geranylgeranyl reductase family protein
VAVVGAGPAGASAAISLAREGVRVVLLERHPLPRSKTCGGGISAKALRFLPPGVSPEFQHTCRRAVLNLLDAGLSFAVTRETPIVEMAMRADFDFQLTLAAQEQGARVVSGCRVQGLNCRGGGVEVETQKGTFSAGFVVAADGAVGTTARRAGFEETRRLIPALESEVTVEDPVYRAFSTQARFDVGQVPGGYGWVFPKKEHLSVGVVSRKRGELNLNERLGHYLRFLGIERPKGVRTSGFVIPVSPRKGPFVRGRTLLTGDAAGLADPVTCEGITHSLLSGQLAGRALLAGDLDEARTREAYESLLTKHILQGLEWARMIAGIFHDLPGLRNSLFRQFGHKLVEELADVFMGKKTYQEIVLSLGSYLGRVRTRARETR